MFDDIFQQNYLVIHVIYIYVMFLQIVFLVTYIRLLVALIIFFVLASFISPLLLLM